ncbi:MAG: L-seryl-tRNA(Sec) selenium transferase, partial [Siculibacillus sp.]|nr:L-seryl-tRNA(Sec) selenium transferase [Siculibacillus sp.]
RLAAIEATLALYRDPDRLAARLPTLRHLARPKSDIAACAVRLAAPVAALVGGSFIVEPCDCASQIGSGALPQKTIASAGLAIRPSGRGGGRVLADLASRLRALPVPVIGRIDEGALVLDLRCLDDEAGFLADLAPLKAAP